MLVISLVRKENCPMFVLEAFSYRISVIGSNIGGSGELIDDGKNGCLFETGKSNNLNNKIQLMDDIYDILTFNLKDFMYSIEYQVNEYLNTFV